MSQSNGGKTTFSAMFWNVERFGRKLGGKNPDPEAHAKRVKKVAKHIKGLNPDLFCLCEIYDRAVLRRLLMHELTDYDFAVTDGGGDIELVTAWKRGTFKQVIFAQRVKFQAGNEDLRPGALASVRFGGEWFNFLFLHLKSGSLCSAYKLRKKMFEKIWALKGRLDSIHKDELRDGASDNGASSNSGVSADGASDNGASSNGAKFVVMGDLNTMGRSDCAYKDDISADEELQQLEKDAESKGMRRLPKTHRITWAGSSRFKEANLDHVLATKNNIRFQGQDEEKDVPTIPATGGETVEAEVRVSGWNTLKNDEDRQEFIDNISDHSSLFCEIVVGEVASTAAGSS